MNLIELIEFLEKQNQDIVVPMGFSNPHSYRGNYIDLAFEPKENVTVREMLKDAQGEEEPVLLNLRKGKDSLRFGGALRGYQKEGVGQRHALALHADLSLRHSL